MHHIQDDNHLNKSCIHVFMIMAINQSMFINPSINQSIKQSSNPYINPSNSQSINQSQLFQDVLYLSMTLFSYLVGVFTSTQHPFSHCFFLLHTYIQQVSQYRMLCIFVPNLNSMFI